MPPFYYDLRESELRKEFSDDNRRALVGYVPFGGLALALHLCTGYRTHRKAAGLGVERTRPRARAANRVSQGLAPHARVVSAQAACFRGLER